MRGNQSTGLISDPASMRRIMRKNKEIERFQRFRFNRNRL
ncbi:hypothetical protein DK59_476 [Brucella abortus bv. 4 str. 292]|nr:hypothetical protein DK59_476 [Brucella abortus bv. 4 str. 292]